MTAQDLSNIRSQEPSPLVLSAASWIETAPRDRILGYQWERIGSYIRWLETQSPFWQRKFREAGVTAGEVSDWESFRHLPTTDKMEQAQILETTSENFGGLLCGSPNQIRANGAVYWRTTGTTGKQRSFMASASEFDRTCVRACARVLRMGGLRPGDSFGITSPVNFWIAGLGLHLACLSMGVTPLLLGPPFDTVTKLDFIRQYRPTGLFVTPTFALRLAEAATEHGLDPRELGVKVVMVGGEVTTKEIREMIRALWQPAWGVRDCGGMSETTGWMFSDCEAEDGLHLFEDIHHCDITDPEDATRTVGEGEIGELIVTSFLQRDMVSAFRFRTNDLVQYNDQPCRCGRTHRRLRYIGRKDDMRVVSGINIFPSNIEVAVRQEPRLGGEFRLSTPPRREFLRLRVEASQAIDAAEFPTITSALNSALRRLLGLNVRIEMLPFGSLARFEVKARRWEDLE